LPDLDVFVGTVNSSAAPSLCAEACAQLQYPYAAIQARNACYCGEYYGRFGQLVDTECNFLCSTGERCGGENRSSVYRLIIQLIIFATQMPLVFLDTTCQNLIVGYQGCFRSSIFLETVGVIGSIEDCIIRCASNYIYSGLLNG
jgi:hypothetical protein